MFPCFKVSILVRESKLVKIKTVGGLWVSYCCLFLEGYYCLVNSTDYSDKPCPSGYYCPAGTQSDTENPCPAGTFNPAQMQTNSSACLSCTAGMYCQTTGLSSPTGNCRYLPPLANSIASIFFQECVKEVYTASS